MRRLVMTTLTALALTTGAAAAQSTSGPATSGGSMSGGAGTTMAPTMNQSGSPTARPTNLQGSASVEQLMNRTVVGSDGERIGKVTDVILGPDGHAQLLVVQSGGFLGIGGKTIAADMALAEVHPGGDSIALKDVTQASVRDMPEFQYDDSMTSLNHGPRRGDQPTKP